MGVATTDTMEIYWGFNELWHNISNRHIQWIVMELNRSKYYINMGVPVHGHHGETPIHGRFNGEYDDSLLDFKGHCTFRHMWQEIWPYLRTRWSPEMICKTGFEKCPLSRSGKTWKIMENPMFLMRSDLFIHETWQKLLRDSLPKPLLWHWMAPCNNPTRAVIDVGQSHPQRGPHLQIMSRLSPLVANGLPSPHSNDSKWFVTIFRL